MVELLSPKKEDKILEIGAGSGWVTSILSNIVCKRGYVYAYEINDAVGKMGKNNLKKYKRDNFIYKISDVKREWEKNAPYDKIISGAAFSNITSEFKELIKPGGCAVVPTQKNDIKKINKEENGNIYTETYKGFIFVPLI